jgi:hypothetical protein
VLDDEYCKIIGTLVRELFPNDTFTLHPKYGAGHGGIIAAYQGLVISWKPAGREDKRGVPCVRERKKNKQRKKLKLKFTK